MIWKLTSTLRNFLRKIPSLPHGAAASIATSSAPPKIHDGLIEALAPKIADELRHQPGALDPGAAQMALATANMLLDAHIVGLKTSLDAQRGEAEHLRQIVIASEVGIRLRKRLAEHRGGH